MHFQMFQTKLKLGKNPKEKAGIFSRLTFFYLDELFASGFASERDGAVVIQENSYRRVKLILSPTC